MRSVTPAFLTSPQFLHSQAIAGCRSQRSPSKCSFSTTFSRRLLVSRKKFASSAGEIKCSAAQPTDAQGHDEEDLDPHAELAPDELELCNNFRADVPLLNKIILTGRLGADPTIRAIGSDNKVCNFSMAVTTEYDPDAGRDQDRTSWFDVEAWGSTAEYISRFGKKGMRVGVSGTLNLNSWTGRDGETREVPIVTADSFEILQSRSERMPTMMDNMNPSQGNRTSSSPYSGQDSGTSTAQNLNDLPF